MTRKPRPLDTFSQNYYAALQYVLDTGYFDVTYPDKNVAISARYQFWQFRQSLMAYSPDTPLGKLAAALRVSMHKHPNKNNTTYILQLENKENSTDSLCLDAALKERASQGWIALGDV